MCKGSTKLVGTRVLDSVRWRNRAAPTDGVAAYPSGSATSQRRAKCVAEGLRILVEGSTALQLRSSHLATITTWDRQGSRNINASVGATRGGHGWNSRISLWERHFDQRSNGYSRGIENPRSGSTALEPHSNFSCDQKSLGRSGHTRHQRFRRRNARRPRTE